MRGKEDGERGRRGIRVWEVGEDGGQLIGRGWSRVDHLQIEFERSCGGLVGWIGSCEGGAQESQGPRRGW